MSKYRVFAFSEQSIKQYSGSAKQPELCLEKYPEFDTIIMFFVGSDLVLGFLKNGKKTCGATFAFGEYPAFHVPIELVVITQSESKEEITFRVGDKVFDWKYGWMIVNEIKSHGSIVLVDANHKEHTFSNGELLRLSFTEYNFVTGGWSQERPKPLPKVGDWGWFWDDGDLEENHSIYGKLLNIDTLHHSQKYYVGDVWVKYFSTENPF